MYTHTHTHTHTHNYVCVISAHYMDSYMFFCFRCNMTLVAHPDKEELIMFGGEYFTGKQVSLLNATVTEEWRPHAFDVVWIYELVDLGVVILCWITLGQYTHIFQVFVGQGSSALVNGHHLSIVTCVWKWLVSHSNTDIMMLISHVTAYVLWTFCTSSLRKCTCLHTTWVFKCSVSCVRIIWSFFFILFTAYPITFCHKK